MHNHEVSLMFERNFFIFTLFQFSYLKRPSCAKILCTTHTKSSSPFFEFLRVHMTLKNIWETPHGQFAYH